MRIFHQFQTIIVAFSFGTNIFIITITTTIGSMAIKITYIMEKSINKNMGRGG